MTRLTEAVESLERDLDKYRGDDENSLMNRRLVVRKALDSYGREQYDEGWHDGERDVHDTRREAQRRANQAAEADEENGGE